MAFLGDPSDGNSSVLCNWILTQPNHWSFQILPASFKWKYLCSWWLFLQHCNGTALSPIQMSFRPLVGMIWGQVLVVSTCINYYMPGAAWVDQPRPPLWTFWAPWPCSPRHGTLDMTSTDLDRCWLWFTSCVFNLCYIFFNLGINEYHSIC